MALWAMQGSALFGTSSLTPSGPALLLNAVLRSLRLLRQPALQIICIWCLAPVQFYQQLYQLQGDIVIFINEEAVTPHLERVTASRTP